MAPDSATARTHLAEQRRADSCSLRGSKTAYNRDFPAAFAFFQRALAMAASRALAAGLILRLGFG